jgi:hypothetical protein
VGGVVLGLPLLRVEVLVVGRLRQVVVAVVAVQGGGRALIAAIPE